MILLLPVKKLIGYKEIPIEVIIRQGTLEDLCDDLGIEFWQIKDFIATNEFDFSHLLLYYGYITACQRRFERPKYTKLNAIIWYEKMSLTERKKFHDETIVLFGKAVKTWKSDKKKAELRKSPLQKSEPLRSENSHGVLNDTEQVQ